MNIAEVVAKMNVYLLNAADVCRKWLEPRLKSLEPNDWWSMIVLPSLSELQQQKVNERGISTLQGLDLQAVLTVARKNIYSFRNIEFYTDYYGMKDSIRAMFEVRNDWAHPTPEEVTLTMTKTDLSRYIDFMERFGAALRDNPKSAIKSLIGLVLFVVVLVVSYGMGSDSPVVLADGSAYTDTGWLKITDMLIYSIYFLFGVAAIGTLVNLSGIFKR